tara:strand:- start:3774 stop:6074 length:2301 start_codon:yes stop_codon:yes gene_type:complete
MDWKLKIGIDRPDVKGAQAALKQLFKELDKIQKVADKADAALQEAVNVKKPKQISFKDIVGANFIANIGSRGAAGAVNALSKAVGLYVDAAKRAVSESAAFENAIVSIARISGSTEAQIAAMSNEFRQLSTEVPVSVKEFQKFADTASRFGIKGTVGIKQFAETFGRLQSIIGPVGEATAKSVARIANLTDFPIENIDRFANSVIALGKNFATSEEQIVRTAERIAQDTAQFGASAAEVLGLATALDALGIKSEKGGSAFLRVFSAIQDKAIEAGSDFKRLATLSGLANDEFNDLSLSSPIKAFELLIASGADGSEIMDRLGLAGVRVQSVLAALSKRNDTFAKSMSDSSKNMEDNNILMKDSARQAETNASKILRLGNAFESVFIGIGSSATDQTSELLDKILNMTDAFAGLTETSKLAYPEIAALGETAKDLFSTALTVADDFVDAFNDSSPVIDIWAKRLEDAALAIGKISKFASTLGWAGTKTIDFLTPDFEEWRRLVNPTPQDSPDSASPKDNVIDDGEQFGSIKNLLDNPLFEGFRQLGRGVVKFAETIEDAQDELAKKIQLDKNLRAISDKVIQSERGQADDFENKTVEIMFESGLKKLGLDDIAKRQARAESSFTKTVDKLIGVSDRLKEAGLDSTEVDLLTKKTAKSWSKFNSALEISGLIDDLKRSEKSLENVSKDIPKADAEFKELNKTLPQVSAITDVVGAGAFISESREASKKDAQEKEKLRIARKTLKVQEEQLKLEIESTKIKIAKFEGGI